MILFLDTGIFYIGHMISWISEPPLLLGARYQDAYTKRQNAQTPKHGSFASHLDKHLSSTTTIPLTLCATPEHLFPLNTPTSTLQVRLLRPASRADRQR
jgi:hypothetical protein